MAAVTQCGIPIIWADEELVADREIVLKNGCALEYAATELRADREILVLVAVTQSPLAINFIAEEVWGDIDITFALIDLLSEKNMDISAEEERLINTFLFRFIQRNVDMVVTSAARIPPDSRPQKRRRTSDYYDDTVVADSDHYKFSLLR